MKPDPLYTSRATRLRPRGTRQATPEGYFIVACHGCNFEPLRDVPEREERDVSNTNHMRTCAVCQRRLCRICLEDGAQCCKACIEKGDDRLVAFFTEEVSH